MRASASVGNSSGIAEKDYIFSGKDPAEFTNGGKTAETGIENANWSVIHNFSLHKGTNHRSTAGRKLASAGFPV